ncbi:hypothetical protein [Enhygromyxa salina]|nr:hypothetical protein [Enhygromyxa salina]
MSISTRAAVFALVFLPIGASVSGCDEGAESYEEFTQLRPHKAPCPMCKVKMGKGYLSLATDYNPAEVTNVSIELSNATATEFIDYGTTITVPNVPSEVVHPDSELCTVGSTGQPPTSAYVEFEITDATATYTVGNYIPIDETCSGS